jgi:hypothetical protein
MRRTLGLGLLLALPACTGLLDVGASDDDRETQTRSIEAFTKLDNAGSADIELDVGPGPSVEVEAPAGKQGNVTTELDGDTLRVRVSGFNVGRVRVRVTTPSVDEIKLTGSGDLDAKGLHGEHLELQTTGSGDTQLGGEITRLTLDSTGSGDVDANALETKTATVSATGSGDLRLHTTDTVTGKTSGSGDLTVTGGASCDVKSSGSGDVRCG